MISGYVIAMENINRIQEQVELILRAKFQYHLCSIWYSPSLSDYGEVGTGNLLQDESRLFVVTCSHVGEKALSCPNFEIALANGSHIQNRQITICQNSEEDDIALLLVNGSVNMSNMHPLAVKDFELIDNFGSIDANSLFFVSGFPSKLATLDTNIIILRPLFYQTTLSDDNKSSKNRLYLDYPSNGENKELPEAPGLSGAGIWKIPLVNPDSIWSAENARCISIQVAWMPQKYLVGTSLTKLFEWLSKIQPEIR